MVRMNDGFVGLERDQTLHPRFPRLFSPLELGPITVKNRIVNSAHQPRFAHAGRYTDKLIAYHRERARGGAAVIVSQATSVTPDYLDLKSVDERIVDDYREVVEAVHPFGARYFAELYHPGRQSEFTGFGADVYYAPSAVPLQAFGRESRIPHELDARMIGSIIEAFGAAAGRCRDGGLDGVELHFAHGNLAEQFMSPITNLRTDEWGGAVENRLRFAKEVAQRVREAVGSELVVGCRLTGANLDDGGLGQLDMIEIAGLMDQWKLLDYFSVTMGHYSDLLNTSRNIPDMTFRPGLWAEYGKGIKKVVEVPVFLVGRINHPSLAEDLLSSGCCDMVVMARALIADPEFPAKAFAGRVEEIRPCVGAMTCMARHEHGLGISCIYNPTVGREEVWGGEPPRASVPRRVVVVGGGPAGLECGRVAAQRGHHVVVLERQRALGGQLRIAMKAPQRQDLGQITEWLQGQCQSAGVEIRLQAPASVELLRELAPDVVVVATGAVPGRLASFRGKVPPQDAWAVIRDASQVGPTALIVDEAGDRVGFSVAQQLAEKGHKVTLATTAIYPGSAIDSLGWRIIYARLLELGVTFLPLVTLVDVDAREARLKHLYTHSETRLTGIDTVVSAALPRADDTLYRSLLPEFEDVRLIGDAVAPRGVEAAVYDGQRVAREI
jgi:N,N-dimethylglycine/sarcosine dehydrogenase